MQHRHTVRPANGDDRAREMLSEMPRFVRTFRTPAAWGGMTDAEFRTMAFLACITYQRHPERQERMAHMFVELEARFGLAERLRLLHTLAAFIEEGRTNAAALLPFVLFDAADEVVAVASREFALLHPSPPGHPLEGAVTLLARVQTAELFAARHAAVIAGLVTLGDMRLAPIVLGRSDLFSGAAARGAVACSEGPFATALQVEFLLDWLEHTSSTEDAIAAADALAALPARSVNGMISEVDRVFPSTAAPAGDELRVVQQFGFAQYLGRIRPRLAALAMLAELEGDGALATLGPGGAGKGEAQRVVRAIERVMECWSQHATGASAAA